MTGSPDVARKRSKAVSVSRAALRAFAGNTAEALSRKGAEEQSFKKFPDQEPLPGYQRGAAGTALFLAEAGRCFHDERMLDGASRWLDASKRIAAQSGFTVRTEIQNAGYENSVFIGQAGVDWVQAYLAHVRGETSLRRQLLLGVAAAMREGLKHPMGLGLTCGLAGYLEIASETPRMFPELSEEESAAFQDVGLAAVERFLGQFKETPFSFGSSGLHMAHGWAGAIWASLRWLPQDEWLLSALKAIVAQRRVENDVSTWPVAAGGPWPPFLNSSWCNGTAGMAKLLARAYGIHKEPWLLEALEGAAVTLAVPASPIPTLCCGAAGEALALFDFGRCTSAGSMVAPIVRSLMRAAIEQSDSPDLSPQLFGGKAGIAAVALALSDPNARRLLGFAA